VEGGPNITLGVSVDELYFTRDFSACAIHLNTPYPITFGRRIRRYGGIKPTGRKRNTSGQFCKRHFLSNAGMCESCILVGRSKRGFVRKMGLKALEELLGAIYTSWSIRGHVPACLPRLFRLRPRLIYVLNPLCTAHISSQEKLEDLYTPIVCAFSVFLPQS
jgi:hypothetical protein